MAVSINLQKHVMMAISPMGMAVIHRVRMNLSLSRSVPAEIVLLKLVNVVMMAIPVITIIVAQTVLLFILYTVVMVFVKAMKFVTMAILPMVIVVAHNVKENEVHSVVMA